MYDYYKIADIYICAFSYPGSSLSTLEAMACGLPVITTAQPWLIETNHNGVFIENNFPSIIEGAVLSLINAGRLKKMGEISRFIVQDYDWPAIARKAVRQYEALLTKR